MFDRIHAFFVRRQADRLAWAEYYGHRFGMARLNDVGTATEREARTRRVWPGDPDEARAFASGLCRAIEDWRANQRDALQRAQSQSDNATSGRLSKC
jgi:hypothetical protein